MLYFRCNRGNCQRSHSFNSRNHWTNTCCHANGILFIGWVGRLYPFLSHISWSQWIGQGNVSLLWLITFECLAVCVWFRWVNTCVFEWKYSKGLKHKTTVREREIACRSAYLHVYHIRIQVDECKLAITLDLFSAYRNRTAVQNALHCYHGWVHDIINKATDHPHL